jgi:hypothetical protein
MQLWTRLAQQQQHQVTYAQQQQQQQQQQPASPSSPPLTGLAAGLRPHYFSSAATLRSPSAALTSSSLSGKHHVMPSSLTSIYPTPPSTPKLGSTSLSASAISSPTPQQAALASMASQTLVQRLGSAFWQAFSGSSSSHVGPGAGAGPSATPRVPAWDAEKIRRVLEGTAVVRVVDVEPPSPAQGCKTAKATAKEAAEVQTQTACMCAAQICASARETGLGVLEESMRALTLGKK